MREPFESSEVIDMVGVTSIYLNKFVERRLYGIVPSDRGGVGRGNRRRFTTEDVFGIGLVWCLFEAGLRAEVIKRILRDVGGSKKPDANLAGNKLREPGADFLIVKRQTRSNLDKQKWPEQAVFVLSQTEISRKLAEVEKDSFLILPIGKLFADLNERIENPQ